MSQTQEAPKSPYLLDLSTVVERPQIRIDGEVYELNSSDDFGALDAARIMKLQHQIQAAFAKVDGESVDWDAMSEEEASALGLALDRMTATLVRKLPEEKRARLSEMQKLNIIQAFGDWRSTAPTAQPTTPNRQTRRTSAKSSRVSSASTARRTPKSG